MTSHDPRSTAPYPSTRLRTARADAAYLATLLGTEHSAMVDFILALAAFDSSRGWAELGHASLFAFLVRHLHLSKASAFHRSAAARLVRHHPAVADALRAGLLCLTSTAELAKVLTAENEAAVLPRFFGLSSREAKELVAELAPHPTPPVREAVTAVARPRRVETVRAHEPGDVATQRDQGGSLFDAAPIHLAMPAAETPTASAASALTLARHDHATVPLTADLRRLHMTVSRRFLQKLEAAREARSHARPNATSEELLEEALDLLLAREEKRHAAATTRPRRPTLAKEPAPGSAAAAAPLESLPHRGERDSTPADVRREVWARDQGRCAWPLDGGGTCGSTHRLELDHTLAAARGGPPTVANLRILCERHNKEAARRTFGPRWMARWSPTRPPGPIGPVQASSASQRASVPAHGREDRFAKTSRGQGIRPAVPVGSYPPGG